MSSETRSAHSSPATGCPVLPVWEPARHAYQSPRSKEPVRYASLVGAFLCGKVMVLTTTIFLAGPVLSRIYPGASPSTSLSVKAQG